MNESIQSKGGNARAEAMSPKERSECASKAARARWGTSTEKLAIPLGNTVAVIPIPMSKEDHIMLMATLRLWKKRIVEP